MARITLIGPQTENFMNDVTVYVWVSLIKATSPGHAALQIGNAMFPDNGYISSRRWCRGKSAVPVSITAASMTNSITAAGACTSRGSMDWIPPRC